MSKVPSARTSPINFWDASLSARSTIPRSTVRKEPKSRRPKTEINTSGKKNVQKIACRSRNQIRIEALVRLIVGLVCNKRLNITRPAAHDL